MRPIIVDIAEFMANPLRGGIQRVVRELLARWLSKLRSEAEGLALQTSTGYADCLADWMVEMSKKGLRLERRSVPAAPLSGWNVGAEKRAAP